MEKIILIFVLIISFHITYSQIGIGTPSPHPSSILDLTSTTKGFLPPCLTTIQRDAILAPTKGLLINNITTNCIEWYNGIAWYNGCNNYVATNGNAVISAYTCDNGANGKMAAGQTTAGITQYITANVITAGSYAISTNTVNGVTFNGYGQLAGGLQNITLTASGTPTTKGNYTFTLNTNPNCSFTRNIQNIGDAICDGIEQTTVVEIISSTGKHWMDRNLGAYRAALSSNDYAAYGCQYQWGRGNDGHASINWTSSTTGTPPITPGSTTVLSASSAPGHDLFIINTDESLYFDWLSPQNNTLWQEINGINNPCPSGYRIPTQPEINAEIITYAITNFETAYTNGPNGGFKFTRAGYRQVDDGTTIIDAGYSGSYWTSIVYNNFSKTFFFDNNSFQGYLPRGQSLSVRCLKS